jgi:hypothetical protein
MLPPALPRASPRPVVADQRDCAFAFLAGSRRTEINVRTLRLVGKQARSLGIHRRKEGMPRATYLPTRSRTLMREGREIPRLVARQKTS